MFNAIIRPSLATHSSSGCSGTDHGLIEAEILLKSLLSHFGMVRCIFGLAMILN